MMMVLIASHIAIGRVKKTNGSPSDLIIEVTKFSSIIVPSTTPKMAGATGNPFSSKMKDTTPKNKISVTPQTELLIEKEPTIQNIKIIGIKILRFTRKILVATLTVNQPSGTMMMLAKIKTKKMA